VDVIPNSLGKVIMERHAEAQVAITFPYQQTISDAKPKRGKKEKPAVAARGRKEKPAQAAAVVKPVRGGKSKF
jgi:hypothetical protein